jgi:heme exporter protein B
MPNPDSWSREIKAIIHKELDSEVRSKAGLYTAGLFSVVTVVAIWFAAYNQRLSGTLAAGLLWVALIFASVLALPRSFVVEEEQGTGELLRLWARPHAVFWGKALFNLVQMVVTGLVLSLLFFVLTETPIHHMGLYIGSILGGCAALAGSSTLCAALASQASSRWVLVGAISLPLMLPLVAIGITATRAALGDASVSSGSIGCIGLGCYAVVTFATGPHLYAAVWRS